MFKPNPKQGKKKKHSTTIPKKLVVSVFERDRYRCQYRSSKQCIPVHNEFNNYLHCHHIVKRRKTNGHKQELLNSCCWACHHEHGTVSRIDKKWLNSEDVYKGGRLYLKEMSK